MLINRINLQLTQVKKLKCVTICKYIQTINYINLRRVDGQNKEGQIYDKYQF